MEINASNYTVEAYISQKKENGKLYPIAFYFRKISLAEANYDIYDKELLVIVTAF
jgi:RNase H-like domain found in reverse transcriptase